ncbi:MAG TPA: 4-hydroxy-3-methylbut-2-enyl diphosphate reductase, partial [Syntrophales bacterium]|nr:4-hydroxy-3-methylbut-2-enyl diphosphate reductase [Syntrophales bacterium]
HNPQTVELLKTRGIIPVNNIDEIDATPKGAAIIIRAHGVSPEEREKIKRKGIKIVDATCPKVAHVQSIIKKHASAGYTVLIVGDREHPEVNGLLGYAEGKGFVIGSAEEVEGLPQLGKVCVVAQTTQSTDDFARSVEKIRKRFPDTVVFDTICDSTEKRQSEVKALAAEMDAVFIVGGRESANTRRLVRIAELEGKPAFHIETAEEISSVPSGRYEKIGISAGASTPNWIIDRVFDAVTGRQNEKRRRINSLFNLWVSAIKTEAYSAIGAGCLSLASMLLQSLSVNILNILTTSLYVYAMHTVNRLKNRKTSAIIGSFREDSYLKHGKTYASAAMAALIVALGLAFIAGINAFILLSLISVLGVLYNTKILPGELRFKSLKDVPGSKNIFMALAWAAVVAVLPQFEVGLSVTAGMSVAFLFTFGIVFVRSAMSDILDLQSDRLIGRETIPVLIGEKATRILLEGILILLMFLLGVSYSLDWTSSVSIALLFSIFFIWIYFRLYDRRAAFSGVVQEGLLETSYIVAGISSLVWLYLIRQFH